MGRTGSTTLTATSSLLSALTDLPQKVQPLLSTGPNGKDDDSSESQLWPSMLKRVNELSALLKARVLGQDQSSIALEAFFSSAPNTSTSSSNPSQPLKKPLLILSPSCPAAPVLLDHLARYVSWIVAEKLPAVWAMNEEGEEKEWEDAVGQVLRCLVAMDEKLEVRSKKDQVHKGQFGKAFFSTLIAIVSQPKLDVLVQYLAFEVIDLCLRKHSVNKNLLRTLFLPDTLSHLLVRSTDYFNSRFLSEILYRLAGSLNGSKSYVAALVEVVEGKKVQEEVRKQVEACWNTDGGFFEHMPKMLQVMSAQSPTTSPREFLVSSISVSPHPGELKTTGQMFLNGSNLGFAFTSDDPDDEDGQGPEDRLVVPFDDIVSASITLQPSPSGGQGATSEVELLLLELPVVGLDKVSLPQGVKEGKVLVKFEMKEETLSEWGKAFKAKTNIDIKGLAALPAGAGAGAGEKGKGKAKTKASAQNLKAFEVDHPASGSGGEVPVSSGVKALEERVRSVDGSSKDSNPASQERKKVMEEDEDEGDPTTEDDEEEDPIETIETVTGKKHQVSQAVTIASTILSVNDTPHNDRQGEQEREEEIIQKGLSSGPSVRATLNGSSSPLSAPDPEIGVSQTQTQAQKGADVEMELQQGDGSADEKDKETEKKGGKKAPAPVRKEKAEEKEPVAARTRGGGKEKDKEVAAPQDEDMELETVEDSRPFDTRATSKPATQQPVTATDEEQPSLQRSNTFEVSRQPHPPPARTYAPARNWAKDENIAEESSSSSEEEEAAPAAKKAKVATATATKGASGTKAVPTTAAKMKGKKPVAGGGTPMANNKPESSTKKKVVAAVVVPKKRGRGGKKAELELPANDEDDEDEDEDPEKTLVEIPVPSVAAKGKKGKAAAIATKKKGGITAAALKSKTAAAAEENDLYDMVPGADEEEEPEVTKKAAGAGTKSRPRRAAKAAAAAQLKEGPEMSADEADEEEDVEIPPPVKRSKDVVEDKKKTRKEPTQAAAVAAGKSVTAAQSTAKEGGEPSAMAGRKRKVIKSLNQLWSDQPLPDVQEEEMEAQPTDENAPPPPPGTIAPEDVFGQQHTAAGPSSGPAYSPVLRESEMLVEGKDGKGADRPVDVDNDSFMEFVNEHGLPPLNSNSDVLQYDADGYAYDGGKDDFHFQPAAAAGPNDISPVHNTEVPDMDAFFHPSGKVPRSVKAAKAAAALAHDESDDEEGDEGEHRTRGGGGTTTSSMSGILRIMQLEEEVKQLKAANRRGQTIERATTPAPEQQHGRILRAASEPKEVLASGGAPSSKGKGRVTPLNEPLPTGAAPTINVVGPSSSVRGSAFSGSGPPKPSRHIAFASPVRLVEPAVRNTDTVRREERDAQAEASRKILHGIVDGLHNIVLQRVNEMDVAQAAHFSRTNHMVKSYKERWRKHEQQVIDHMGEDGDLVVTAKKATMSALDKYMRVVEQSYAD